MSRELTPDHARILLAHIGEPVGERYPEWTAADGALLEDALDCLRELANS